MLRAARWAARNTFFAGFILKYMTFALPVERLYETSSLLAFKHPSPSYAVHILLMPKKPIASFADLDPVADSHFLVDLAATVQKLVRQFNLEARGYRLITNGGPYQEFPILHFHLVNG